VDFRTYQTHALQTDTTARPDNTGDLDVSVLVPLLGLASEAGELLGEYKKHLRDQDAHLLFRERIAEELGDLLWYVANVASKFDLDLDFIANSNLSKVRRLWSSRVRTDYPFDHPFPDTERLPRQFEVELKEVVVRGIPTVITLMNGQQVGDPLTDNARDPDGYRFHDVFHLSYAAVLGWSPITRKLLRRKRKSNDAIDRVEDGGRAAAIEEGVSALVFSYARRHRYLEGVTSLDYTLLRTIVDMTAHLEVGGCSTGDWQRAILDGYRVWREIVRHLGGRVSIDLDAGSITFAPPKAEARAAGT
jgi:NTP pyrophosphatase (non-canonical NTP hydrolase)